MIVKRSRKKTEPYVVQPVNVPSTSVDETFAKAAQKLAEKHIKAGKPHHTTEVRLVRGSLRKNCCKDRSRGAICGSVYEEITRDDIGRIVKSVCYPNKHERKLKQRKDKVA